MGMDISNGNGEVLRFPSAYWAKLLELAYEYGWQPAGTELGGLESVDDTADDDPFHHAALAEQNGGWNGTYTSNDGQLITAEDANAIAEALERALNDSPDNRRLCNEELVDYFRAGALRIF